MTRGERLFKDAAVVINGGRQNQYGGPEDSFGLIAQRWTQFLTVRYEANIRLSARDVALMMADLKIARELNQAKRDNLVDAAGYLGIYDDLVHGKD